jgi:hypothetical protein
MAGQQASHGTLCFSLERLGWILQRRNENGRISDSNSLDFIERDFVMPSVVELRCPWIKVVRHLQCFFHGPAIRQRDCDPWSF